MSEHAIEVTTQNDLLIRQGGDTTLTSRAAKHHTRFVRLLRLILPVMALSILAILMLWKSDTAPVEAVPREDISPETVAQNELINPKFQSEDSDNQPYTITADKATQNSENMDMLLLQKPVADMTLKSGGWVSLKANEGTYSQGEKNLSLKGDIEVHHDSGYELRTQSMTLDLNSQVITVDTAVTGQGDSVNIKSAGMVVNGTSKTLIFKGPVTMTLREASDNPALHSKAIQTP
jgi:lipopolysaccharide export system protein LptC